MKPLNVILAEARRASGHTQSSAAAKMGLSLSCLGNIESDPRRSPSYDTLGRMVEAYKMDPRVLFEADWNTVSAGDTDLTRAIRGLTSDGELRWQILSTLHELKLPRDQIAQAAKQLGVVWSPLT